MSRYKDVDEILEAMDTWPKYGCKPDGRFIELTKETEADYVPYVHYDDMVQAVTGTPVQDVAPVIHAYNKSKDSFLCSACTFGDFGLFNHGGKYTPKYCPNCGARMDGVRNDR